jgi:NAD(P)-dependent dehydrogenase (short-subunit alcohol dehydrogenase family)
VTSVLVIGASGALGRVIARAFEAEGWDVLHGARRPVGGDRFRAVDLDHAEDVGRAIDGVDLVVNTVPGPAMTAERLVLERGGVLLNVAAPARAAGLALRRRQATSPAVVVPNAGLIPGLTNLVARDLLAANPQADLVEIVLTFSTSGTSGPGAREWMHGYLTRQRYNPIFTVPLPPPYGVRRCMQVAHEDRGWLADEVIGAREVRTGVCALELSHDAALRALNAVRLLARLPRKLFSSPPRLMRTSASGDHAAEPSRDPIAEWVAVYRRGERLGARTIEGEGDYRMTAAATVAASEALMDPGRERPPSGVHSIEQLLDLKEVLPALQSRGIRIADRGRG